MEQESLAEKLRAAEKRELEGVVTPAVVKLTRYVAWLLTDGALDKMPPDEQDAAIAKVDAEADALPTAAERVAYSRWVMAAFKQLARVNPRAVQKILAAAKAKEGQTSAK